MAQATTKTLRQQYGDLPKIYQAQIPIAVKAAEISAAVQSIFAYSKGSKVAKAFSEFTNKVMADGERAKPAPADSLLSTQEQSDDTRLEKIMDIPLSEISDFPNHPFKVKMDTDMLEMAESAIVDVLILNSKAVPAP